MDDNQKNKIRQLRANGLSYRKISRVINVPENTVKSHCQRNRLGGKAEDGAAYACDVCRQCGKSLVSASGKKQKKFCSDKCRLDWWKAHPEQICRKAIYILVCSHCGMKFESYGNRARKFCSHECYIRSRFGKENSL
jgi:IS30 family transposase